MDREGVSREVEKSMVVLGGVEPIEVGQEVLPCLKERLWGEEGT